MTKLAKIVVRAMEGDTVVKQWPPVFAVPDLRSAITKIVDGRETPWREDAQNNGNGLGKWSSLKAVLITHTKGQVPEEDWIWVWNKYGLLINDKYRVKEEDKKTDEVDSTEAIAETTPVPVPGPGRGKGKVQCKSCGTRRSIVRVHANSTTGTCRGCRDLRKAEKEGTDRKLIVRLWNQKLKRQRRNGFYTQGKEVQIPAQEPLFTKPLTNLAGWLTPRQVVLELGCSSPSVQRLALEGRIRRHLISREGASRNRWLYNPVDVAKIKEARIQFPWLPFNCDLASIPDEKVPAPEQEQEDLPTAPTTQDLSGWITSAQAAIKAGCTKMTIRKAAIDGYIRREIGPDGLWLYHPDDVLEFSPLDTTEAPMPKDPPPEEAVVIYKSRSQTHKIALVASGMIAGMLLLLAVSKLDFLISLFQ